MTEQPSIIDVYAPCAPGSNMRSHKIDGIGRFRLARRHCELYSVQILSAGAWGRFKCSDGRGRELFMQPSTFTGSFWLSGGALDGLVVEVASLDRGANLTINWREPDGEII